MPNALREFQFTEEETQLILRAVMQLPYLQAAPILAKMNFQHQAQNEGGKEPEANDSPDEIQPGD